MAGRIPEDFINEVRNSVNIVDVISQYVSLEKKGKDYIGLCPFHQEKTPSFTVNEEKQFFKCFGCGKGGNVYKFLMYKDNLTFPESVEQVANFAHISMPSGYSNHQTNSNLTPVMKINQDAADFYHRVLVTTRAGERGMAYAKKRELDKKTIDHFGIGYAPQQENLLLLYLRGKNYQDDDLVKSGLFIQSKSGELYDRFRDRLMFPLSDESGRVIAFSGRRLSNDKTEAKYMNSPETEIFTKSKLLFHFAEAKKAAREEKHLVLYEGYMDVIAAYKAGVKSGIASMGTSLTDEQVYMMRRNNRNIIINYDGDDPGVHAAERAVQMFKQAGGFNIGVVVLPEGLDPDEYVKKYGEDKYYSEVKGALSATDFLLKRLAKKFNLNNDLDRINYLNEAVKEISNISDPVQQDLYLRKIADENKVSFEALKANLLHEVKCNRRANRHKNGDPYVDKTRPVVDLPTQDKNATAVDPVQLRLLYLFLKSDQAREYLLARHFLFPSKEFAQLEELWLKFIETHENPTVGDFYDFIPEQLQGIIESAELAEMPEDFDDHEIDDQIQMLEKRKINLQLDKLMKKIKDAERKQDSEQILVLTQQLIKLKRVLG
ncbi:DNA primase [Lactobacillus intestinalis]|uniref:DNA primase n=3 Tax=Lactobacillus intestinalis TaxID=151781 RepID=A0A4S2BR20_9LACO|nr:DNA primase [Lactobacillus intestinalis]KAI4309821.1 DNA primase [Lactobacillus intestinalis]TGY17617.1 DNA primase [Lactobacillus intestinalis]